MGRSVIILFLVGLEVSGGVLGEVGESMSSRFIPGGMGSLVRLVGTVIFLKSIFSISGDVGRGRGCGVGCWEGRGCWSFTGLSSMGQDGSEVSSGSTTVTSVGAEGSAAGAVSLSTLAAPFGMAEGAEEFDPGVSSPEVDPLPASGSTFSFHFSCGFSPSLVMMVRMRSQFL